MILWGGASELGGVLAVGGTIEDIEAWPDRIGEVTVSDVSRVAKEVLGKNPVVVGMLLPEKKRVHQPTSKKRTPRKRQSKEAKKHSTQIKGSAHG
jgi:zinc protease